MSEQEIRERYSGKSLLITAGNNQLVMDDIQALLTEITTLREQVEQRDKIIADFDIQFSEIAIEAENLRKQAEELSGELTECDTKWRDKLFESARRQNKLAGAMIGLMEIHGVPDVDNVFLEAIAEQDSLEAKCASMERVVRAARECEYSLPITIEWALKAHDATLTGTGDD